MHTPTLTGFIKPKIAVPKAIKRLVLHTLIVIAAFLVMGELSGLFSNFIELLSVQLMGFVAILGCLHIWALYHYHKWVQEKGLMWEVLFTCGINLLGGTVYYILVKQNDEMAVYAPFLFCATCFFSLPFFVDKALVFHAAVPSKEYQVYFTLDEWSAKLSMALDTSEMGFVWHFDRDGERDLPRDEQRTFAPVNVREIQFGKFFEAFLLWYNTRICPENPIQVTYVDEQGNNLAYKWEFFHRRYRFSLWMSRVNPSLTVGENHLRFKKRQSEIDQTLVVKAPLVYVRRYS